MESSKELIKKITSEKDVLIDVINSVTNRFTTDLEIASTVTREQFIDYCKNQVTAIEKENLMSDVKEANPEAIDDYYIDRVKDDADYLSMDEVNDNYVKCDDITLNFIKDNFGNPFLNECADEALCDMSTEMFVQTIMDHLDADKARKLVLEIIEEYM